MGFKFKPQNFYSILSSKSLKIVILFSVLLSVYKLTEMTRNGGYIIMFENTGSTRPCVLPEVDPFDPKMMKFVKDSEPIICDDPAIVYVDSNNTLQFNDTALILLKERRADVECLIYPIKRQDDDNVEFLKPLLFSQQGRLRGDFFRTKCTGSNGVIFDNFLTRIEGKKRVQNHISNKLNGNLYNVVLFGLDSVSRSSAIRQLPKTYKYLTKTLGGYDFKGYNKVEDGTFTNIVPLLTGRFLFRNELPNINYEEQWLDSLPLIFKNFSAEGCVTLYAEDYPNLNTFNMDKKGFQFSPTDHYMRPFWRAIKRSTSFYNLRSDMSRFLQTQNWKISKTSGMCLGDRPNHVIVMDYIKQFMNTYSDRRKIAFSFLTELGHEYQNLLQLGDDDIYKFLKWMSDSGHLSNTILIMFSDHGLRFGSVQHLYVARIENRMPFLNIVLPDSLKAKYPRVANSMKVNQARLASTFDVHATLRDILHGKYDRPGQFKINNKLRGISLFQELPKERSCSDASISEHFCACHTSVKLNITNNPLADRIALKTINVLNRKVQRYPQCAKLKLGRIIELSRHQQALKVTKTIANKHTWFVHKKPTADVQEDTRHAVVLETLPGRGVFYGTCDVYSNGTIRVFENVDRVNKYGNQSHCIDDHELKPVCFCV